MHKLTDGWFKENLEKIRHQEGESQWRMEMQEPQKAVD